MLEQILNSIDLYFYKLGNQLEELKSYYYISRDYSILIERLQKHNEKMKEHFVENTKGIRSRLRIGGEISYRANDYNAIAFYFEYINSFNFFISNIKNSRNVNIHQGNFILTEEITKYISRESNFLILPFPGGADLNYGYIDVSSYLNKFNRFSKEEEVKDFLLFFIPYFNQEDIFDNSALGHEIGHFIEEKYSISNEIIELLISNQILKVNIIEDTIKRRNPQFSDQDWMNPIIHDIYLTLAYNKWIDQTTKWIKEIVSDMIGLKIFGFASFFALIDIMFLTKPDSPGDDDHPPNWLRIKYFINEIKKKSYSDLKHLFIEGDGFNDDIGKEIQKRVDFIDNIFETNKQTSSNELETVIVDIIDSKTVQKAIDEKLDNLIEEKKIKEFNYNSDKVKEIIILMKLMMEYVIPNEIVDMDKKSSKPADIITILNAGWFFYLCKLEIHYDIFDVEETNYDVKSEIQQKLNNLILKAIELSKIHENANKVLKNEHTTI